MSLFVVDVEANGPCPGIYSMTMFAAVRVDEELKTDFFSGLMRPISPDYQQAALASHGLTYKQTLSAASPAAVMGDFQKWLESVTVGNPIFVSDNPAFDWQFINYNFHRSLGANPFGFSARRIGDIYTGLTKDMRKSSEWKKFRKIKHTHNPLDDARGNAEALIHFAEKFGLKL